MAKFTLQKVVAVDGGDKADSSVWGGNDLLIYNARWFTRVRWIVASVLILFGLLWFLFSGHLTRYGLTSPAAWPIYLGVILALANTFYCTVAGRLDETSAARDVESNIWLQIIVDLIVLTVLVHYVGSIQTFVAFTYLFHIVLACIFFVRRQSLMVTFLATALYLACVAMEISGSWARTCILQHPPLIDWGGDTAVMLYPVSAVLVWIVVWYLVSTLSATVHIRDMQLTLANERLRRADREKNQQMLRTAHDLKAPFSGMESNIQVLRMVHWDILSDEVKDLVERIDNKARLLRERIRDILMLGHLKGDERGYLAPVITTVNIHDLIESVVGGLKEKADSRQVVVDLKVPPVMVESDSKKLETLFSNLISNAVNYSQENSKVEIVAMSKMDNVIVSVRDHGIGIEEEALPHIFEDFYSSARGSEFNKLSTGLGLAIVREIAHLLNLRVNVVSEPGKGSMFEVVIPGKAVK